MYLSRVEINMFNRQRIKDLSHLGAYHNWIESCFPDEKRNGQRLRHLWRIDKLYGKQYLLLVSEEKPDLKKLEYYGVEKSAETKDYQPFLSRLYNGELVRFKLTANPTYRTDGKVYPHITISQQKEWLISRAEKAGFSILPTATGGLNFDISDRQWPILYHGKRRIRLSRVTFEGVLQVTNVEQIRRTLVEGIGREKAYGMGMLTVIPMEQVVW